MHSLLLNIVDVVKIRLNKNTPIWTMLDVGLINRRVIFAKMYVKLPVKNKIFTLI